MIFYLLSVKNPKGGKHLRKRVERGLYQDSQGQLINADCNGAANMLRKADATPRRRQAQGNARVASGETPAGSPRETHP